MKGDRGTAVRLRYTKRGKVCFISHRDTARAFERAFRIAQLPLAFSAGFSPRPKLSFGLALSTGYQSDAEYLDLELVPDIDELETSGLGLEALQKSIDSGLPDGLTITGTAYLAPRAPALQEAVTATRYCFEVVSADDLAGPTPTVEALQGAVERTMSSSSLIAERRRKGNVVVDDLRPALRDLRVLEATERGVLVELEVATQPRGARPREVLPYLGADLAEGTVIRTHQWIERDGARHEPLAADTRPAPSSEVRGS